MKEKFVTAHRMHIFNVNNNQNEHKNYIEFIIIFPCQHFYFKTFRCSR